jgi:lysophospholipase L1-like esterase
MEKQEAMLRRFDGSEIVTDSPCNKLYKKQIIWNGDSICQGATATGTWATRVAEWNQLKSWKNYGVGGGTITENVLVASTGKTRHSVSASLEKMHEEFPNADYIILEGGTNDADLLGRITEGVTPDRFGSFDPEDFSGNYDRDTFCGALESIFYRAKQLWEGKKICYIVAQKMGTYAATSDNRYAYFQVAMEICEKWDIPYLNLWDDCELDPNEPEMYNPSKSPDQNEECSMYRDGQHLTSAGYELTTELINAWLKTL